MADGTAENVDEGSDRLGPLILAVAVLCLLVFGALGESFRVAFLFTSVIVISIGIWQACDPFADAAQWIGDALRLPGSVRGATLDAVASSIPELFSGIFFVVLAIQTGGESAAERAASSAEGFGSTIATCAGSAVYNMILIPAAVALVIAAKRSRRPTVDVEPEVVTRDGLWFVGCEILLILFLSGETMHWWMAVVFLLLYCVYIVHLYFDAKRYRARMDATLVAVRELRSTSFETISVRVGELGHTVAAAHVHKAISIVEQEQDDDSGAETAGLLFGRFHIRLNAVTAWLTITLATCAAAVACYFLVEVTRELAQVLGVPTFFVAVIVAAAASSVPDTFLSIGSGLRGDDSGAVSNAFGSNIFDICICLSIPLLVNSYLLGWEPVSLLQDGRPIAGLVGLRILLVCLTIVTLAVIWHRRQLTRGKAVFLCGLYLIFVAYAVLGSLGYFV